MNSLNRIDLNALPNAIDLKNPPKSDLPKEELFNSPKFNDLPLNKQNKIVEGYFDGEIATNDKFKSLPIDKQQKIKDNFLKANKRALSIDTTQTVQNEEFGTKEKELPDYSAKMKEGVRKTHIPTAKELEKPLTSSNSLNLLMGRSHDIGISTLEGGQKLVDWINKKTGHEPTTFFKDLSNKLSASWGGKKTHTPETIKKAFAKGGVFNADTMKEVLGFGLQSGAESIADMGAMTLNTPAYIFSFASQMADARAENDGRKKGTAEDMAVALPFAVASIAMEKLGLKGMTSDVAKGVGKIIIRDGWKDGLKQVSKEVAKGTLKEGGTEFIQEGGIEYLGETAGTKKKLSSEEAFERGAWGALAGGLMGGAMSTATGGVTEAYQQAQTNAILNDTSNITQEKLNEVNQVPTTPTQDANIPITNEGQTQQELINLVAKQREQGQQQLSENKTALIEEERIRELDLSNAINERVASIEAETKAKTPEYKQIEKESQDNIKTAFQEFIAPDTPLPQYNEVVEPEIVEPQNLLENISVNDEVEAIVKKIENKEPKLQLLEFNKEIEKAEAQKETLSLAFKDHRINKDDYHTVLTKLNEKAKQLKEVSKEAKKVNNTKQIELKEKKSKEKKDSSQPLQSTLENKATSNTSKTLKNDAKKEYINSIDGYFGKSKGNKENSITIEDIETESKRDNYPIKEVINNKFLEGEITNRQRVDLMDQIKEERVPKETDTKKNLSIDDIADEVEESKELKAMYRNEPTANPKDMAEFALKAMINKKYYDGEITETRRKRLLDEIKDVSHTIPKPLNINPKQKGKTDENRDKSTRDQLSQQVQHTNRDKRGNEDKRPSVSTGANIQEDARGISEPEKRTNVVPTKPTNEGRNERNGSLEDSEGGEPALEKSEPKTAKKEEQSPKTRDLEKEPKAGGKKQKFQTNLKVLELLKEIQEGKEPTAKDKDLLAKYVGWGGLSEAFSVDDRTTKGWENEVKELEDITTPKQLEELRRSTQDSHYTPKALVNSIWKGIEKMGFQKGSILEPSIGVGNFIGMKDKGLHRDSVVTGVEMDTTTAQIAKALYGNRHHILNSPFQDFDMKNGSFDVVIGNPPFGLTKLYDKKHKDIAGISMHNYFVIKSLRGLKEGGILGVVVSSSLMDTRPSFARDKMAKEADLIGAFRLPKQTFKANAGTEVITDVLFFKKKSKLFKSPKANKRTPNLNWLRVDSYKDTDIPINQYFLDNPQNVIGDIKEVSGRFGNVLSVSNPNWQEELNSRINEVIPKNIFDATPTLVKKPIAETKTKMPTSIDTKADIKVSGIESVEPYSYFIQDNKLMMRLPNENGTTNYKEVTTKTNSKFEEVPLTPKETERIKGMATIANKANILRRSQLVEDITDKELNLLRKDLTKAYKDFVSKHGFLNAQANKRLFKDDILAPFVLSLEKKYDSGVSVSVAKKTGETARKPSAQMADIFKKRTQEPFKAPESAKNPKDALLISLTQTGGVDINYMQELLGGKSKENIVKELGDLVYEVDGKIITADEYLSGNVKKKYKETNNPRNKKALKSVFPKDIEATDITIPLGVNWLPLEDVSDFAKYILGRDAKVSYSKYFNKWDIQGYATYAKQQEYGTDARGVESILESALNDKKITVTRDKVVDREATALVAMAVDKIKTEFKNWIWKDKSRRDRLSKLYNEKSNNLVKRKYNGTHLKLQGKISDKLFKLREHQLNGVWRVLQGGTVLFDHTVGSGKTATAIASIMELRRTGKAKKPLIVVPNSLTPQWGKEWLELYPNAKVLVPTENDFSKHKRKLNFARIATGDYDAIIIGHSQLAKIPNSLKVEESFIGEEITKIDEAIKEMNRQEGKQRSVKQAEAQKDRLKEKLKKLIDTPKDEGVLSFTEMGIDAMVVDEAHEFKNLGFTTSLDAKGIGNPQGSQKALDMYIKTQTLLKKTNNNNLIFMTGTPISNSIAEMYTLERYLNSNGLKERGLEHFDAWAKTNAEITTDWEIGASGQYKLVSRLSNFINLPELISNYSQFSDVVTIKDINNMLKKQGLKMPIPKLSNNNKPTNIIIKRSKFQADFIGVEDKEGNYPKHSLVYRSANIKTPPKKGDDNMLSIMGLARKVALDERIINPTLPDNPKSKTNIAVKNIVETYKKTDKDKGTQLVFCDLSTPSSSKNKEAIRIQKLINDAEKGNEKAQTELDKMNPDELDALNSKFSVYDDMKAKLIKSGIPENEIAFIHDANTKLKKEVLFAKVNSGKVRVLIGSTSKMGAGMNVQERLVALHHLDVPWRPSDLEQREGRIKRQGNKLYTKYKDFTVDIKRYATEGTLDAMMWQIIEAKANFIEQLRAGSFEGRVAKDIGGEAVNAGQMKALSSGNPLMLRELELKKEIEQLTILEEAHNKSRYQAEDFIEKAQKDIVDSPKVIEELEADVRLGKKIPKEFNMLVGDKVFKDKKKAGQELLSKLAKVKKVEKLGQFGKFKIVGVKNLMGYTIEIQGQGTYDFNIVIDKQDPIGLTTKINNIIKSLPKKIELENKKIKALKRKLPELKKKLTDFDRAKELKDLKAEHINVVSKLREANSNKKSEPKESKEDSKSYFKETEQPKATGSNNPPLYKNSTLPDATDKGYFYIGDAKVLLPKKIMTTTRIRNTIESIVGARQYYKKIKGKSLGFYDKKNGELRYKSYDNVEIMAHEIAHFLDFHSSQKSRFKKLIKDNSNDIKSYSYTADPRLQESEGFAEFVRAWLTNVDLVVTPKLKREFEAELKRDKKLYAKMLTLQKESHIWYQQGHKARLSASLGDKRTAKERLSYELANSRVKDLGITKLIDRLHGIKVVETTLKGKLQEGAKSAYKLFRLTTGGHADSTIEAIIEFGSPTIAENGDLKFNGKGLKDVFEPTTRFNDDTRFKKLMEYFASRQAQVMKDEGKETPFDDDMIQAGLNYAKEYKEFRDVFNEYQEFEDRMLDFYVQCGSLTAQARENMKAQNEIHVPMFRVMERDSTGNSFKARKGSSRNIKEIEENILTQLQRNVSGALKARAKNTLYTMIAENGDNGALFATKIDPSHDKYQAILGQQASHIATYLIEKGLKIDDKGNITPLENGESRESGKLFEDVVEYLKANKDALTFYKEGIPTSKDSNIDSALIDGELTFFEIQNNGDGQVLNETLMALTPSSHHWANELLFKGKVFMTRTVTSAVDFFVPNIIRDTFGGSVYSKNKQFLPIYSTLAGMAKSVNSNPLFKDFLLNGGGYGTRIEAETHDTSTHRELLGIANKSLTHKVMAGARIYDKTLSIGDYGTRMQEYALTVAKTTSRTEGAFDGIEIGTDFGMRGGSEVLDSWLRIDPFTRAGINGLYKFIRTMSEHDDRISLKGALTMDAYKAKVALLGVAYMTLPALIGWWNVKDEDWYKNLTQDERVRFTYFGTTEDGRPIKKPIPFEIGVVFEKLPVFLADYIYQKEGNNVGDAMVWSLTHMFLPEFTKGVVQPFYEIAINKKFTGADIVPFWYESREVEHQFHERTPEIYKRAGVLFGVSPLHVEHITRGYLRYFAKYIEEATDAMAWNSKKFGDRPFVNAPIDHITHQFLGKKIPYRTRFTERFKELKDRASRAKGSFNFAKKYSKIDGGELLRSWSAKDKMILIAIDKTMKQTSRYVNKATREVGMVRYNKSKTREEKEKEINLILAMKNEILNKIYVEMDTLLKKVEKDREK